MAESPTTPPGVDTANILASNAVSGSAWATNARVANHLLGRGRVLVPAYKPPGGQLTKGSYTYAFRMVPTYNALVRRWRVSTRSDGAVWMVVNGTSVGPISPREFDGIPQYELTAPHVLEQEVSSQSDLEESATVTISSASVGGSSGALHVDSIECIEIPRKVINEDANERGVRLTKFISGQPLRASAFANMLDVSQDPDIGKRVLLHWAVPYEVGGSTSTAHAASTSSSSWTDALPVEHFALARKLYNDGKVTTDCKARFFAWVSPGGTGYIRVLGTKDVSSAVTVTNTSPAWSSQLTDVPILAEGLATPDGESVSDGHDEIQVQIRAQTGTIYMATAVVFE